jgi:hypothetical protein
MEKFPTKFSSPILAIKKQLEKSPHRLLRREIIFSTGLRVLIRAGVAQSPK